MARFPNTFAEQSRPLPADLGERGNEAAARLAEKGFEVRAGLTVAAAGQIALMATEPHIREFCPRDATTSRFGHAAESTNLESTEAWLQKGGGRAMLMPTRIGGDPDRPVGYGWTGPERSSVIPDGETTFAVRVGEEGLGQGLSKPFSTLIVAGSAALYGARNIWLETWASNERAVASYQDIGFQEVDRLEGQERPTADGGTITDTRVYMEFPNDELPPFVDDEPA